MRAKFLLAGIFALLAECAVANAVTMTTVPEIEPFNLTAPQVNFEVSNVNGKVAVTTNSPQIVFIKCLHSISSIPGWEPLPE